MGVVTGMVLDRGEAVILNALVAFETEGLKREVVTDQAGRFTVRLPAGVYRVSTKAYGYCDLRRAAFRLAPGASLILNLRLTPSGLTSHQPPPSGILTVDQIPLAEPADTSLDLLLQFGSREVTEALVRYRGVVSTYDALTIDADTATYDAAALRLEFEGNVVVDKAGECSRVRRAVLDLKGAAPVLTVTGGAILEASGNGSIDSGRVRFKFRFSPLYHGQLDYEDRRDDFSLISLRVSEFRVLNDDTNEVEVKGVGYVNGIALIDFTVRLRDAGDERAREDWFSVEFGGLEKLSRSGYLDRGNITVRRDR
jgi:hypothetical protein